ncbi:MAG: PH domain-containing protein [Acidimicrobiales bacterium]
MVSGRVEITDVETESLWQRPSPKLRRMRRSEVGLVALVVLSVSGVVSQAQLGVVRACGVIAGVLLLSLLAGIFIDRRCACWGYLARDDDLLIRRGVLIKRLSVVPYGRMQFVDVTAGLFERLFGIATVRLHTAAAATDARLPGLAVSEAARLREQLTLLGEARAAGI